MKPVSALLVLFALACALPSRALRLEPETNHSADPQPVVDIEDESHVVVAHLFVMPGETMQLDSNDQKPAAGAGYYVAMPGEDYLLQIPVKFQLPRLGMENCPCILRMDKIGWNHQGAVITVAGLRPYLETASGNKIAIVSNVKHLHIAAGKFYFHSRAADRENTGCSHATGRWSIPEARGGCGMICISFSLICCRWRCSSFSVFRWRARFVSGARTAIRKNPSSN